MFVEGELCFGIELGHRDFALFSCAEEQVRSFEGFLLLVALDFVEFHCVDCALYFSQVLNQKSVAQLSLDHVAVKVSADEKTKLGGDLDRSDIIFGHVIKYFLNPACEQIPDNDMIFHGCE